MIRAFEKLRFYHSTLGLSGAIIFIFAKGCGTQPFFKTKVTGIKHPIYLRIGTTDATVLRQVLIEKHYDMACPIVPKIIVDAGANIGLSAIFFANKYPAATIIALEPESSNFLLLSKNVSPYPQIKPLQAALWKVNTQINLIDNHFGHHAFQTVEGNPSGCLQCGLVQALTVDDIMSSMGLNSIDLLKIDIEGAEKEVFENSKKWIDKVKIVMAELHDNIKPGCCKAFMEATETFCEKSSNGETVMRFRTAKCE
jgi:FkbM family methyltransferase